MTARGGSGALYAAVTALVAAVAVWGGSHLWAHTALSMRNDAAVMQQAAHERQQAIARAQATLAALRERHTQLETHGMIGMPAAADWHADIASMAQGRDFTLEQAPTHLTRIDMHVVAAVQPLHLQLTVRHEREFLTFLEGLDRITPGMLRVRACTLVRGAYGRGLSARCHLECLAVRAEKGHT